MVRTCFLAAVGFAAAQAIAGVLGAPAHARRGGIMRDDAIIRREETRAPVPVVLDPPVGVKRKINRQSSEPGQKHYLQRKYPVHELRQRLSKPDSVFGDHGIAQQCPVGCIGVELASPAEKADHMSALHRHTPYNMGSKFLPPKKPESKVKLEEGSATSDADQPEPKRCKCSVTQ